jgi:hypothetical protein
VQLSISYFFQIKSVEIQDAVFYTDWSRDEAYQYKTDKILAINRAQTPAKLTLGGFTNLDLLSFTVVR